MVIDHHKVIYHNIVIHYNGAIYYDEAVKLFSKDLIYIALKAGRKYDWLRLQRLLFNQGI